MDKIKEAATPWTVKTMADLEALYISRGQKASGAFGDSLEARIEASENSVSVKILGAPQIGMMQGGRKPNENQDPKALKAWVGWAGSTFLKAWVKDKGLSISPFAVAWKIAKEGVKVPNPKNDGKLLDTIFTPDRIDSLIKIVGGEQINHLKSKYLEAWQ